MKLQNIQVPRGENWHKELLNISVLNGIISEELSDELYEYLTFRHFFVHAYGFMLEEAPLDSLVNNIPRVWEKFISQVSNRYGS